MCPEKRDQNVFFVISSTKLGHADEIWCIVFGINLLQNYVNVSHLTLIMSLHYLVKHKKLKMLIAASRIAFLEKETREFIPPQLRPPNSPDLNPGDYRVCGILQQKVHKTCITNLDLSTTPMSNGCHSYNMIQLNFCPVLLSVAVSVRPDQ